MVLLNPHQPEFPDPGKTDPSGILAVGGIINPDTLIKAYRLGVFPWYNDDLPLWWHPDPRFVLFPEELKVSKSMRPYFNQNKYTVTFNQRFEDIITQCKHKKRKGQGGGTWINEDFIKAYTFLHKEKMAVSVEVYEQDQLVGGLYGITLGKVFYGESMYTDRPNASKFGFISLVRHLRKAGTYIIDCQQKTSLLTSLGGKFITRQDFMDYIYKNKEEEPTYLYDYLSAIR